MRIMTLALALSLTACADAPVDASTSGAAVASGEEVPADAAPSAQEDIQHEVVQVPDAVQGTWAVEGGSWVVDNNMVQKKADGAIPEAYAITGTAEVEGGYELSLVDTSGAELTATVKGGTLTLPDGTALSK